MAKVREESDSISDVSARRHLFQCGMFSKVDNALN